MRSKFILCRLFLIQACIGHSFNEEVDLFPTVAAISQLMIVFIEIFRRRVMHIYLKPSVQKRIEIKSFQQFLYSCK